MTTQERLTEIHDLEQRVEDVARRTLYHLAATVNKPTDESRKNFRDELQSFEILSSVLRGSKLDLRRSLTFSQGTQNVKTASCPAV